MCDRRSCLIIIRVLILIFDLILKWRSGGRQVPSEFDWWVRPYVMVDVIM